MRRDDGICRSGAVSIHLHILQFIFIFDTSQKTINIRQSMDIREETLAILKKAFAPDDAYKLLEYIDSKLPEDIATQKDVYALKLEIEKVRADLSTEIANVRVEVEKVRADLSRDIEKVRTDLLKWSFTFWIAQMALLAGILFKLLS